MILVRARLFVVWFVLAAGAPLVGLAQEPIRNPYYPTRQWKVWSLDEKAVEDRGIRGDDKTVKPPAVDQRIWLADPDPAAVGQFMRWVAKDYEKRPYAGIWDDVYSSQDNAHSYIRAAWDYDRTNAVNIAAGHIHFVGGMDLRALGVNFTSQSTTGMGHDLANTLAGVSSLEKDSYFSDILRAGPTHLSFTDSTEGPSHDLYEALAPCFFNSVGSSGSETWALMKMVIAGGYLPKEIKPLLKRNGLYPATMLYIWKASLPYDVPYDHELRHRVAYNAKGDHSDHNATNRTQANWYGHAYDESAHMRNMVELARKMTVAPPIALLRRLDVAGGEEVYALKTAMLVRQTKGQTVRIRVSTADSYDLQDKPLTFRWKVLYGNKDTTVVREGTSSDWTITVPWDDRLPRGRTSILLVANNGRFDSNPAVVNVYRTIPGGRDAKGNVVEKLPDNRRPQLWGLEDRTILPGEEVRVSMTATDPEGFPVSLYRWANEVGEFSGNTLTWKCPASQPDGDHPVTIIASDGTCGYSLNSGRAWIHVRSTIAALGADRMEGVAPLTVKFSSTGSRDKAGGALTCRWDFDDGGTSEQANPEHTFTQPGLRIVRLTVRGPSGAHTVQRVIEVRPNWPMVVSNGWSAARGSGGGAGPATAASAPKPPSKPVPATLDKTVWQSADLGSFIEYDNGSLKIFDPELATQPAASEPTTRPALSLKTAKGFQPPFCLEIEYEGPWENRRKSPVTGFHILGTQVGMTGDPAIAWPYYDYALSYPTDATTQDSKGNSSQLWRSHVVGPITRFPWSAERLRVFVENDPAHPGRVRMTGYVDTSMGRNLLRVEDWPVLDDKLGILSACHKVAWRVRRFQVWAPAGDAPSTLPPRVRVLGRGESVFVNQSKDVMQANGTQFGWPEKAGGTVTRTFTLRNDGDEPLKVTGPRDRNGG